MYSIDDSGRIDYMDEDLSTADQAMGSVNC